MEEKKELQKTGKSRAKRKKRRFLAVKLVIIITAVIIIAALAGWRMLTLTGKDRLYKKGGTMNSALLAQPGADQQVEDVGWEEGWIRYNGSIYRYNEDIITLLVLGIDKETDDKAGDGAAAANGMNGGQSDANFLVVINPVKESVQLICINRDTMTEYQTYDYYGNKDAVAKAQLCLAHAYGNSSEENCKNTVEAVQKLFYGLPIHGVCAINMDAIPVINDAVGGVTVNCLQTFKTGGYSYYKGSSQNLQGMGAYWYVKYRNTGEFNSNGDRLQRQKQYLNAFIAKAKSSVKKNPSLIGSLYNSLAPYMTTDIKLDEASYLADTALGYDFDMENVITLEGETIQGTYYEEFYPDEQALRDLIIDVFYEEVEKG